MMKKRLLFLFTILSFNCYSQISFEPGYYIDNNNNKTNGLIKNVDWADNPTGFEFQLSANNDPERLDIKNVKEFGIDNTVKFIRSSVDMDRSGDNVNNLSDNIRPNFNQEELFLKVLVEGKANLYQYIEGNLKRYFYSKGDSDIEQLIYKKYKTIEGDIRENNRFRQQLWNDLQCPDLKKNRVEKLEYKKNALTHFFEDYSKCLDTDFTNFKTKQERDFFNLTLRPRISSSSLAIHSFTSNSKETDFGSKLGFGFGLEAEYILPFNKNKWGIAIEPTYQQFKSEKTSEANDVSTGQIIATVDYTSIEVPVGLRHYFFLKKDAKIFLDASFVLDFTSNSSVDYKRGNGSELSSLDIDSGINLAFGIGYKQNNKYSLELRYQASREILDAYSYYGSEYKTISLIFGYSLF